MSTLNFPTNPSLNDTYSFGTKTWIWNGAAWQLQIQSAINGIPIGNITPSTGAFTTLSASGLVNLGAVGNLTILGGESGQVLTTDGLGELSFTTQSAAPVYTQFVRVLSRDTDETSVGWTVGMDIDSTTRPAEFYIISVRDNGSLEPFGVLSFTS